MTIALSSLTFTGTSSAQFVAQLTQTGLFNSLTNSNRSSLKISLGNGVANNVAGGADELLVEVVKISASSTATINLASFTDAVGQTTAAFARVKYWRFQLLSEAQDSVNGTNCTSVTIGNAGSHPFLFNLGGTTPTVSLNNGGVWTGGDVTAAGYTVTSGTNNNILITNNDGANAAAVLVVICGGST